jgi:peptidoglycan/xylan/chitin deacetylase (PgdA/CDA1 family)
MQANSHGTSKSWTSGLAAFLQVNESQWCFALQNGTELTELGIRTDLMRKAAAVLPPSLLRPLSRPVAVFFHGVEREIADPEVQENHLRIEEFARIARTLKTHFDVTPISELERVLHHPQRHRGTVFLMSDDGYANTLSVAAPVLRELKLPWTLFVSTRHIDESELSPMFLARTFLREAPDGCYRLPHFPQPIHLNGVRHVASTEAIERLRFLPAAAARQAIVAMVSALGQSAAAIKTAHPNEHFLTWDGIRELSRGGVAIGAHADLHWAMHPFEDLQFLKEQAEKPRQRIEEEVGPCRYFAYPFGNTRDIGRDAWQAVRDVGYDFAFTTLGGTLNARQNPWLLPRYGLHRREPHLPSVLPLLRFANRRVSQWHRALI